MKSNPNCIFCNSPLEGKNPNERLHLSRWIKAPNGQKKKEKVIVDMPTCETCHHKFHPHNKPLTTIAAYASGIAPLCLIFSLIEKETFVVSPLGGIIILVVGGILSYGIIWFLSLIAISICDDAFSALSTAKPYSDLPFVQGLKKDGFIDGEGDYLPPKDLDDKFIAPIGVIREAIRNRYSCNIIVEK